MSEKINRPQTNPEMLKDLEALDQMIHKSFLDLQSDISSLNNKPNNAEKEQSEFKYEWYTKKDKSVTKELINLWNNPNETPGDITNYKNTIEYRKYRENLEEPTKPAQVKFTDFPNKSFEGFTEYTKNINAYFEPGPFIAALDDLKIIARNRNELPIKKTTHFLGGFIDEFKEIENFLDSDTIACVDIFGKFRIGTVKDIKKEFRSHMGFDIDTEHMLIKGTKLNVTKNVEKIYVKPFKDKKKRGKDNNGLGFVKEVDGTEYRLHISYLLCGKIMLTDENLKNPVIIYGNQHFIVEALKAYKNKFGTAKFFIMDNGSYGVLPKNSKGLSPSQIRRFETRNTGGSSCFGITI